MFMKYSGWNVSGNFKHFQSGWWTFWDIKESWSISISKGWDICAEAFYVVNTVTFTTPIALNCFHDKLTPHHTLKIKLSQKQFTQSSSEVELNGADKFVVGKYLNSLPNSLMWKISKSSPISENPQKITQKYFGGIQFAKSEMLLPVEENRRNLFISPGKKGKWLTSRDKCWRPEKG